DAHAADEATLDVLTYLGRRLHRRPLLLLLAWRSDSVPAGHRLRRLEGTMLALKRLGETEVGVLVGEPDVAARVFAGSAGRPLFVAESLATLAEGGEPGHEMRDLVPARVAALDATTRQLLETAAVIGRSFSFDTLRRASGRGDDEATDGLDELVARGLVR